MPMTWNNEADVRLFCTILKVQEVKIDFQAVAAAMGDNVTAKALIHRIAKLKSIAKEVETGASDTGGAPVDGPTKPTTKKARAGSKDAGSVNGPRGRKRAANNDTTATNGGEKNKRSRAKRSEAVVDEQVESQVGGQGDSRPKTEDAGSDVDGDDVNYGHKSKRDKKENISATIKFQDDEDEEE